MADLGGMVVVVAVVPRHILAVQVSQDKDSRAEEAARNHLRAEARAVPVVARPPEPARVRLRLFCLYLVDLATMAVAVVQPVWPVPQHLAADRWEIMVQLIRVEVVGLLAVRQRARAALVLWC